MPVFNMLQGGGNASSGGGNYGTLPEQIINFQAKGSNGQINLTWNNPNDENFSGVLIRRKTSTYPTSPSDGVQVYSGNLQTVEDTGLTNGTTYYYRAFAYNANQEYQTIECFASAIPVPYYIYGVCIDTLNSNPETSVTYVDDAIGMTGGSADWNNTTIFKDIKPCVFQNGTVQYYLNPDDLTKKVDGTNSILTGADGDVMIEIPKMGLKMVNDSENNKQYVYITDNPSATSNGFHYYAHTRDVEGDREKLYIGAYLGQNVSSKLHSYSGVVPTANITLTNFRTYAQANGTGYDLVSFYPLTLLQALYLVKYKNLDSQTALGQGYSGVGEAHITGSTNSLGRDYGTSNKTQQMCFQNIEDFWGNFYWWIDGFYCNSTYNILTATNNFNDTGSGYSDCGQGATSNIIGFMSAIQGASNTGFVPKLVSSSSTTYYCDHVQLSSDCLPFFGGNAGSAYYDGAFLFQCSDTASRSFSSLGARLMYL